MIEGISARLAMRVSKYAEVPIERRRVAGVKENG